MGRLPIKLACIGAMLSLGLILSDVSCVKSATEAKATYDNGDTVKSGSAESLDGHRLQDLSRLRTLKYTEAFSVLSEERRWAVDEASDLRERLLRASARAKEAPLPVPTISDQDYQARLSEIDNKTRVDERAQSDKDLEERQRFSAGLELVDLTRQRARLDLQLEESRSYAKALQEFDDSTSLVEHLRTETASVEHYLYSIDDAINQMLTTTEKEDNFRLTIAFTFAGLVAFLIIGFFVLARQNKAMRESFLSDDRGLQFMTLFALIIAIVIFGVMNILEGRELSALLGGLSGYILGRTRFGDPRREDGPDPDDMLPK